MNVFQILVIVGGGCFIGGLIKPAWPLACVGGLLLAVALLIK